MRNLAFVIWMIGFPLSQDVAQWLDAASGQGVAPLQDGAAILVIALYAFVGTLTYEGKPDARADAARKASAAQRQADYHAGAGY